MREPRLQSRRPPMPLSFAIGGAGLKHQHAHDILENLLERYYFNGQLTDPGVQVVSFYADQTVPKGDMTQEVARQYRIPLFPTMMRSAPICGK